MTRAMVLTTTAGLTNARRLSVIGDRQLEAVELARQHRCLPLPLLINPSATGFPLFLHIQQCSNEEIFGQTDNYTTSSSFWRMFDGWVVDVFGAKVEDQEKI